MTGLKIHLSPAAVSRRFGVGPKALRLYDARGLVTAARDARGWRWYGPAELARLHQVLALKALRLSLSRIAALMAGGELDLDAVLAAHEAALAREARAAARALGLVRAARARLAAGQSLSVDDLATLAKETVMPLKSGSPELGALLERHVRGQFTEAEIAETSRRPFDQASVGAAWDGLIAEARALMAAGDPASPAALDLARRWKVQVEAFTGGDPGVARRVEAVWRGAMADPAAAPALPLDPALFAFMGQALAGLAKAGG